MATEVSSYDFLQGEGSVYDRIREDMARRLNARPRTGLVPTLTTSGFRLPDGSEAAEVVVTYSPVRKDMDYILQWKRSTESRYTFERSRTSPHVIRPVPMGATINVGLSMERRQTGARGRFGADANITTPPGSIDTTPPAAPTGLACSSNPVTGTVSLQWNAVTDLDLNYYSVVRGTNPGPTDEQGRVVDNTFEDINATIGNTYFYRVAAVDIAGNRSAFSNEVSCTVIFLGTLAVVPNKTSVLSIPGAFATAITQRVTIPAGSQRLFLPVNIISNTLSGSPVVRVRFSVGSSGSNLSNTATMTFNQGGQQIAVFLQSAANLSVSGETTMIYEWEATGTISGQFTSPGAIEVRAS